LMLMLQPRSCKCQLSIMVVRTSHPDLGLGLDTTQFVQQTTSPGLSGWLPTAVNMGRDHHQLSLTTTGFGRSYGRARRRGKWRSRSRGLLTTASLAVINSKSSISMFLRHVYIAVNMRDSRACFDFVPLCQRGVARGEVWIQFPSSQEGVHFS
jgi:hypothetical protein